MAFDLMEISVYWTKFARQMQGCFSNVKHASSADDDAMSELLDSLRPTLDKVTSSISAILRDGSAASDAVWSVCCRRFDTLSQFSEAGAATATLGDLLLRSVTDTSLGYGVASLAMPE